MNGTLLDFELSTIIFGVEFFEVIFILLFKLIKIAKPIKKTIELINEAAAITSPYSFLIHQGDITARTAKIKKIIDCHLIEDID